MINLTWILSSCILILAVAAIRTVFSGKLRPWLRYALWGLVLLRLLIPAQLFDAPWSVEAAIPERELSESIVTVMGDNVIQLAPREPDPSLPEAEQQALYNEYSAEWKHDVAQAKIESGGTPVTAREVLHTVWLAGIAVTAAVFLASNLRFYARLRKRRKPLDADCPLRVYSVEKLSSSCLFGNAVYISDGAARDEAQLRYVLAHELSHRRHGDRFWVLLRCAALALHWYNPLVWWAASLSRQDSELCADAGALHRLGEAERENYGAALIELSARRAARASLLCTATTMTNGKKSLKERVMMIARRPRMTIAAVLAVLLIAGVAAGCAFAGKPENTPDSAPDKNGPSDAAVLSGAWASVDDYIDHVRAEMKTVNYYSVLDGESSTEKTASVTDTRVKTLEKDGELSGLTPDGTLELYNYMIETKLDVPLDSIRLVGGMHITEDGWCELEGQGGHSLIVLRYSDGSIDALFDHLNNDDRGGLYYYEESAEEMLYDWYVKENDLDLPLYTVDLTGSNEAEKYPAHRFDGDGWYVYIPISVWQYSEENGAARWTSAYGTGSTMLVRESSKAEQTAERPQLADGQSERFVETPLGRVWLIFTQYDPEMQTHTDEPGVLHAMAESFTVAKSNAPLPTVEQSQAIEAELCAAADPMFGTLTLPPTAFYVALYDSGHTYNYTIDPALTYANKDYIHTSLTDDFEWRYMSDDEIAQINREPKNGSVIRLWNEKQSFEAYENQKALLWTELDSGEEHWFYPMQKYAYRSIYNVFFEYARRAEGYRTYTEISVPGTVTDYEEVARQISEQYVKILMDHPEWYQFSPNDAAVNGTSIFDAYYGDDMPNFCFGMGLVLKLDETNKLNFEAGSGLGDPIADGPYKGWYHWGREISVELRDGVWRYIGMATGGSSVWLPYGIGRRMDFDNVTTEQLVSLCFVTSGSTRDWNLMYELCHRPAEDVRAALDKLNSDDRNTMLGLMEAYNTENGRSDYAGAFDLSYFR